MGHRNYGLSHVEYIRPCPVATLHRDFIYCSDPERPITCLKHPVRPYRLHGEPPKPARNVASARSSATASSRARRVSCAIHHASIAISFDNERGSRETGHRIMTRHPSRLGPHGPSPVLVSSPRGSHPNRRGSIHSTIACQPRIWRRLPAKFNCTMDRLLTLL